MKKVILTLSLLFCLGLTATSCSTDDSTMNKKQTTADEIAPNDPGTGDHDLPKLPQHP